MWSFNREIDDDKIATESAVWKGPFSWPGYGDVLPDVSGVYLFTFPFKEGYVLYSVWYFKNNEEKYRAKLQGL